MITVVDTSFSTKNRYQRCHNENDTWMKLVVPWVTIAIIACSYTVVSNIRNVSIVDAGSKSYHHHEQQQQTHIDANDFTFMNNHRRMKDEYFDDDTAGSDYPATPTTGTASSSSSSSKWTMDTPQPPIHPSSHHKPVFQEDHKPLFPLDKSDWYGVFFTIVGLVVAAGGGIGGGGILVPIYM